MEWQVDPRAKTPHPISYSPCEIANLSGNFQLKVREEKAQEIEY
jgi:hypothetical protein